MSTRQVGSFQLESAVRPSTTSFVSSVISAVCAVAKGIFNALGKVFSFLFSPRKSEADRIVDLYAARLSDGRVSPGRILRS